MITNNERILHYLWSMDPIGATNSQIGKAIGINSSEQIYAYTQDLLRKQLIRNKKIGKENIFSINNSNLESLISTGKVAGQITWNLLTSSSFREMARNIFSQRFGIILSSGEISGIKQEFDFISPTAEILGHSFYFSPQKGFHLPLAKFAVVSELIWIMEMTPAQHKFIVFGYDIEIPVRWLNRFGSLTHQIDFYFLSDDGKNLDHLNEVTKIKEAYSDIGGD